MADEGTQHHPTPDGEPSPAEKLAQPAPTQRTEADQATRTESGDNTTDKAAKPRTKPQGGVPVAKLSGIGIPVTVMLFILAFLWKGPVFALGVLAAIALALAVIWAVRSIASRPATTKTPVREPRQRRPANPPAPTRPAAAPHRSRQPGGGSPSRSNQRRPNGGDQPTKPKLMDRLRPNRNRDADRSQSKRKPAGPGDKSRSAARPPGKGNPPAAGKLGSTRTTDKSTTKPGAGAPGKPPAKNTQGNPSSGRPGSKPTGSKPSTSNPSGSKPQGAKPSGGGSSGAKSPGGGKSPAKPQPAASKPAQQPVKDKTSGATTRDRRREEPKRSKPKGRNDVAGGDGGRTASPTPVAKKPETKKARKNRKAKQQKTVNTPKRQPAPVDPRNQWVVRPGATVRQPTDPAMKALADRVRAAGGVTPPAPKGSVASLEEKRTRNLADRIRKAGKTTAPPAPQQAARPAKTNPKSDNERFNAVYGHMIDLSSPESKASSLMQVSEKAGRDQLRLSDQADQFRADAAALPEKGYEEEKARLLTEAARLEEDSETRGHWKVAAADRAETFAAEANGVAI